LSSRATDPAVLFLETTEYSSEFSVDFGELDSAEPLGLELVAERRIVEVSRVVSCCSTVFHRSFESTYIAQKLMNYSLF
jgi:hypothetical protein